MASIQTVEWMPHGTEAGLDPRDIVLDGDAAHCVIWRSSSLTESGTAAPHMKFSAHVYCGQTVVRLATAGLLLTTVKGHV